MYLCSLKFFPQLGNKIQHTPNLASVVVKFSHLIWFKRKFYKYCTFNVCCEDNAAINCFILQDKYFTPVTFDGSHASICV